MDSPRYAAYLFQLLVTQTSQELYKYVKENMNVLRRLAKTKIGDSNAARVCEILDKFSRSVVVRTNCKIKQ